MCGACSSWILCAAKVTSQLHKSIGETKLVQYLYNTHTYLYMQQDCARAAEWQQSRVQVQVGLRDFNEERGETAGWGWVRVRGSFKCLSVKSGWTKAAAAAAAARLLTKLLTQLWGMPQICARPGGGEQKHCLVWIEEKWETTEIKWQRFATFKSCCCCCFDCGCCLEIPAMQHARCICKFWIIHTCDEEQQQRRRLPQLMLPHFLTQLSLIRPYAGAVFSLKLAKLTMKWFSQPIRRTSLPALAALAACTAHHLALIWHLLALALSPRCAYLTRALRVSDLPTLLPPPSPSLCIPVHPFSRVSHCLHTDCVCVCERAGFCFCVWCIILA